MDVLQRRLAAAMPTSTTIKSESKMAASVQQLKSRCALAKGRHDVRYVGYDAAFELIRWVSPSFSSRPEYWDFQRNCLQL